MNLYLLIVIIFFALGSTIALWLKLYSVNRHQGLFAFFICFPSLPLLAWTHKKKCKVYLSIWLASMVFLVFAILWLSFN